MNPRSWVEEALKHNTVLLLGEIGSGKATLAQTIHNMSQQSNGPFIHLDCAAMPAGLLEGELFGCESGSSSGIQARRVGKMEDAQRGTLLLDNIGDLPIVLQCALLRALRRGEFRRLGGRNTVQIGFRLIAATNRSLAGMASSNQFRQDLLDRLSPFSIRVPSLRGQCLNISTLATHFMHPFTNATKRPDLTIPTETMLALEVRQWPGNIQELRDLIERSVLLSPGSELLVSLDALHPAFPDSPSTIRTLREVEREHIGRALQETNGVVGGNRGAASILGVKRTTLQYRMKRLRLLAGKC